MYLSRPLAVGSLGHKVQVPSWQVSTVSDSSVLFARPSHTGRYGSVGSRDRSFRHDYVSCGPGSDLLYYLYPFGRCLPMGTSRGACVL